MDSANWIAVGSIATALVVLINLAILFLIPWYRRPRFSIEYRAEEPFFRYTFSYKFETSDTVVKSYYIRLKVINSGKSVARHCLGKLVKIMDENGQESKGFDSTQLHWVSTNWQDVPFRDIDLNRDDYEYLDILVTQASDDKVYLTGDQHPWAKYEPRAITKNLPPGKYILRITVYGENVKPETKYVSLIWGGSNIDDISIEIQYNLQDAKSWLKKRELTSAVGQPKLDTSEHGPQSVSLGRYIACQIPTYFILGLILIYEHASAGHILSKCFFALLATIALVWTFGLWTVVFNCKLPKKLERVGLITKYVERGNQIFYAFASVIVLAVGFIKTWADLKGVGINTPFSLFLFVLWFLLLILNIIFTYRFRRQEGRRN